nr:hypothetical protein [uncultured Acetatifactor sp.]
MEDKTRGTVYFEAFYLDGTKYEQVLLHIADGQVSGSSHPEITVFFEKQPLENKVVCELGFGMNPNVTELCGYTVLLEKCAALFTLPSAPIICSAAQMRLRITSILSAMARYLYPENNDINGQQ